MGLSPNFKSSKIFAVITERHFYVLFCNGDSPISGKLPIEMGRQLVQCQTLEFLITLIYIKIFVDYVGDICGWCRLLALIQAVFLRGGLTPPTKQSFSRPALDFIDAPTALDASGALGVHSTEGRCVFFFDGVVHNISQLKRGNSGVYLWSGLQPWRLFSLKWSLAPREGDSKNLVAQRFAPAMWHNCFSTNWGHLFFVFDRHGKNTCFNTYSICELQAMTRKPRLVIDWACGRLLFRSLEEPDSLESVFGSLHGWGKLRFWMVLNFADLRWFEGGTAFDHQM